ncbi:MAG: ABC transporter permease subunit [Lachnospiraceae bacterium]|nr:ABC transporter permease subunit [Lachnospiraceae bacterium]
MKKTVIGLNLNYFFRAAAGALISLICLFIPYASVNGKRICMTGVLFELKGSYVDFILITAVIFTVILAVMGIVLYFKTTVRLMKLWQAVSAVLTVSFTLLLFAGKKILETAGIYDNFLNRNYSFGFWIGLIAAYFTLISIMKMTRTNRGYILLVILSVIWLFPILWIVITSLRSEQGYYVGYFIPHGITLQNFVNLFSNGNILPFGKWWLNTFIVAVCGCVFNTMIVLMTAFILSRTRFSGRKTFMNILMIIGMFPGFMSLIAVYNILKGIGLNQSLLALIVVGAAGAAMGYHVTKGFFDTIPKALDEAAIIDGASRFQIFSKITLPLSKSIIVYIVLGGFLGAWSDYIFPSMLFGDKQSSCTVAVGLFWMTDFRRIDTYYTQFAAGAVLVALPIVILFVWLQRFYVEGLSGAVKG